MRLRTLPLALFALSCGGRATSSEADRVPALPNGSPGVPLGSGGAFASEPPSPEAGGSSPDESPPDRLDDCQPTPGSDLLWEPLMKEVEDGSASDGTYTWFSPDEATNGGDAGLEDGGICLYPPCDTLGRVRWVNGFRLCGYGDWRLPTLEELLLLGVDDGREVSGDEPFYWSSESFGEPEAAWGAYLCCGGVPAASLKSGQGRVRLVRDVLP